MNRTPPHERPTAQQLANGDATASITVSGKLADACPYCGCGLYVTGTRAGVHFTFRYVKCRNRACGRAFTSKQPPATLIREVEPGENDESSSSGRPQLTLVRESA